MMTSVWRDPLKLSPDHHQHTDAATPAPTNSSTPSEPDADKSGSQNVECVVCGDKSSGKHYGQYTCEGCKSFFKRSVRRNLSYTCRGNRNCPIDQHHRNQCQYCRLRKCIKEGMRREAVQRGRIPTQPMLPGQYAFPGDYSHGYLGMSAYISQLIRAEPSFPSRYAHFPSGANYLGGNCTPENVRESAAQLLWNTAAWCQHIPYFSELNMNDQISLLRHSWSELFILNAAQFGLPCHPSLTMNLHGAVAFHSAATSQIYEYCKIFYDRVEKLKALHIDGPEYVLLKAIVLYSSDVNPSNQMMDTKTIDQLQFQSQLALEEYERSNPNYANQPARFGQLLLRLPTLRSVSSQVVEQIFFSHVANGKGENFDQLLRAMLTSRVNGSAFNSPTWPLQYPVAPALPPCQ